MLAGNSLKMVVGADLEISSIYRHKKIEKISVGPFQPTYNHICRYLIYVYLILYICMALVGI